MFKKGLKNERKNTPTRNISLKKVLKTGSLLKKKLTKVWGGGKGKKKKKKMARLPLVGGGDDGDGEGGGRGKKKGKKERKKFPPPQKKKKKFGLPPNFSDRNFSKHRPSGPMLSIRRNVRLCVCPSVCLSVCVFTFEVPFNGLFAPTSRNQMSNIFRDSESLGKSNGKKWSQI